MTQENPYQEVKTELVNFTSYKTYRFLNYLFFAIFFLSALVSDIKTSKGNRGIKNHIIFSRSFFAKNKFIKQNYDTLKNIGLFGFFTSIILIAFCAGKMDGAFRLGYFKVSPLRLNATGNIFQWSEVTLLRITINSPKVFGKRSAVQGFSNWVQFDFKGKGYKYEFYLENQVMEDGLLKIINEIITIDGKAQLILTTTPKSWRLKVLEELGVDPQ